ncbi:hypothetical protein A9Q99_15175 [Gammaproteobacteria bacterium 45_16_T64]|nr:hypothetical protein A9Q99_15175 [Gammaproteobacteria bacterium 45_16_T64]
MRTLILLLLIIPTSLFARVEPYDERSDIQPERQVTIVNDGDKEMHIHQVNGKVYGIKVVPKLGPAYYLIDPNGNGKFIRNDADKLLVPQWTILEW